MTVQAQPTTVAARAVRSTFESSVALLQALGYPAFVSDWVLPDGTVGIGLATPLESGQMLQAVVFIEQSAHGWSVEGWVERDERQVGATQRIDAPWHSVESEAITLAGAAANALLKEALVERGKRLKFAVELQAIPAPRLTISPTTVLVGSLEPGFAREHIFAVGRQLNVLIARHQAALKPLPYDVVVQGSLPIAGAIPAWMAADRLAWTRARRHQ